MQLDRKTTDLISKHFETQRALEHPFLGVVTLLISRDDELSLADIEPFQFQIAGQQRHCSIPTDRGARRSILPMNHQQRCLARGRLAEIFPWGERSVLKLFRPGYPAHAVRAEVEACRHAVRAGLAVPRAFCMAEVQERHGFVCERVEGPSMLARLARRPLQSWSLARQLARLHASIHRQPGEGLPTQGGQMEELIAASDVEHSIRDRALLDLRSVSPGSALCHGDFHPDNVLLPEAGAVTIDWTTACMGDPVGDVAMTALILELGRLPEGASLATRAQAALGRRLFRDAYVRHYRQLTGTSVCQLEAWSLPVAVARLARRLPSERRQLSSLIERLVSTTSGRVTLAERSSQGDPSGAGSSEKRCHAPGGGIMNS